MLNDGIACVICHEDIDSQDNLKNITSIFTCEHKSNVHPVCLKQWLKTQLAAGGSTVSCPICREQIDSLNTELHRYQEEGSIEHGENSSLTPERETNPPSSYGSLQIVYNYQNTRISRIYNGNNAQEGLIWTPAICGVITSFMISLILSFVSNISYLGVVFICTLCTLSILGFQNYESLLICSVSWIVHAVYIISTRHLQQDICLIALCRFTYFAMYVICDIVMATYIMLLWVCKCIYKY